MSQAYDPRTIALLSEIIHPPLELAAQSVQAIHNELYQHAEFSYQNFAVTPQGITLSNLVEQEGAVSSVNFLPDRIQIREELSGAHVDDFGRRLEHVAKIAIERLSIPILVAQQHVVRSLINPRHFADSREFLAGAVCGLPPEDFGAFERPIELYGMRLLFPAITENGDNHAIRIESFRDDSRCVWLEDVATFTTAVMPGQLDQLASNMRDTYDFVRSKVLGFLARFDRSDHGVD